MADRAKIKELEHTIGVVVRAIPRETEAQALYRKTAQAATLELVRHLFEKLADQEAAHETKLRAILELLREELREARGDEM